MFKRFACGDVVPGCDEVFSAGTEAEVLESVARHAADHGIIEIPDSLVDLVRGSIEDVGAHRAPE